MKSTPPNATTQVLIIGYVWPEPNSSAAGSHMISFIKLFLAQGWQVCFASPAQLTEHMVDLQTMGVKVQAIPLNDSAFDSFAAELNPDIVLFDRFMMEEQFGWRISQHCPNAIKLLDTEDLHSLRHARHIAHKAERSMTNEDLASDYALREVASIYRCDLSFIISDFELALLQQHFNVPAQQLCYCPFMLDLANLDNQVPSFDQRTDFISIGNFRHAPNWDAVLWLRETIWPLIRKQLPQAQLHIYGAYPPPKATALHNPKLGFLVRGWAPSAEQAVKQSRILLAPLRFGAGIKGKLTDAMLWGTPSVTTEIGAEGMAEADQWPGVVAHSAEAFADAAVALYNDQQRWQQCQQQAVSVLKQRFDGEQIGQRVIAAVTELQANLSQHRLRNFTGAMLQHHHHKSTQYMAQWIEAKNKVLALTDENGSD
ncbi:glycosyltransferase [Corallincola luteus]|nr:glycosyltransferase [Corallincola luteus]